MKFRAPPCRLSSIVLVGIQWLMSLFGRFTPKKSALAHTGQTAEVGPRAGMDTSAQRSISVPAEDQVSVFRSPSLL